MFPPDNEQSSSPPEPIDPFAHGVFISPEEDAEMEMDRARKAYFHHLHNTVDGEDIDMNTRSTEVTGELHWSMLNSRAVGAKHLYLQIKQQYSHRYTKDSFPS